MIFRGISQEIDFDRNFTGKFLTGISQWSRIGGSILLVADTAYSNNTFILIKTVVFITVEGVELGFSDMSDGEPFDLASSYFSLGWWDVPFFLRTFIRVPCPPVGSEVGCWLDKVGK